MTGNSAKFRYESTTRKFLDAYWASSDEGASLDDIRQFRATARQLQLDHTCEIPDGVELENLQIFGREGAIPIRIYRQRSMQEPAPALVYFHGGAWVIGGLDECDGVCSHLCRYGNVTVVSVDYRLAPEYKFPAALCDSIDAAIWVSENAASLGITANKIGVAGDSAGGNLAAAVCQQLHSLDETQISRQVLLYPCLAPHDPGKFPSRSTYGGDECFLSEAVFGQMLELYRRTPLDDEDPLLWPILNEELAGLPSAYIVTAEFDMLRDEGEAYGQALAAAGVRVTYKNYAGTIHGFVCLAGTIRPGVTALDDLCSYLRTW